MSPTLSTDVPEYRSPRILGLVGAFAFTMLVYWANVSTPPQIKLGLLYLVPVMIATWYAGLFWGTVFTLLSMALRMQVELNQLAEHTTLWASSLNQISFAAVCGIAMSAFRNIQKTQLMLHALATHDPLTQVLNARSFEQRLTQELERNRRYKRPMALLYLDLDDFKTVNDSHGHQTGDAVLRLVADAIRGAVRQADAVGRMGGDEFAVLMPETDAVLADAAAQRLASGVGIVFEGSPQVTASIGLVSCTATDAGTDAVLRRADQAMYDAKRAGKNRVVKATI